MSEQLWQERGNYQWFADQDVKRFFPKNKDGKSVPVTQIKYWIVLKHIKSGVEIVFSRYKHQKRWYWRDSRDDKSTRRDLIVGEIARLLQLSSKDACAFVSEHLAA